MRTFPFRTKDGRAGIVREARNADARAALAITAEAMHERPRTLAVTERELWSAREWRRHRLGWDPAGVTLVAEVDGGVAGVLSAHRGLRPSVAHVAEFGITVATDLRSRGVGRSLIEAAEDWAREYGVIRMTLRVFATNERAHALYRALGYEDEGVEHAGVRFPEGTVDVVRMYKFLTRPHEERAGSRKGEGTWQRNT
ncbi:MAG: N-acetyltransferase family protein [Actinomycetota bacterium]|nr:GNAT family N-acetyltransferase [Actinomycetota bacterium]